MAGVYLGTYMCKFSKYFFVLTVAVIFNAGCHADEEVDYRSLIRSDGLALDDEPFDAADALCSAALATDPAVANETDPHCRAMRMAGVCIRQKICP